MAILTILTETSNDSEPDAAVHPSAGEMEKQYWIEDVFVFYICILYLYLQLYARCVLKKL